MTPAAARADYDAAKTALTKIINSDNATDAQRRTAEAAREQLTIDFIEKKISEIEALSVQYASFIARMNAVLKECGGDGGVIQGITTLREIVDRSGDLLKE